MKNSILKQWLRQRGSKEDSMKIRILGILAGIVLLLSAGSVYAGEPPPKPEQISFAFASVVYQPEDLGTCDPSTGLPYAGDPACVASIGGTYTLTGDLVGTEFETDSLLFWPDGGISFTGYGVYTGTLNGHRTGSFVAFDYDAYVTPSGVQTGKLRIVDGTGTGDLVGISGSGSYTGAFPIPAKMTVKFLGP
jgi:Protein of unknown function (DUF3224)